MNEKEIMQDMVNFAIWIVKNVNNFDFLKNSQGVKKVASAKNEEDIKNGLIQIEQEVNDSNKMKELYSMYSQSKNKIQMNKRGSKIDYLVNKFEGGGITIYTDDGPIIKKPSSSSSSSSSSASSARSSSSSSAGSKPLTIYGSYSKPIIKSQGSTLSKAKSFGTSSSSSSPITPKSTTPIPRSTTSTVSSGSSSPKRVDYLDRWEPLTSEITKLNEEFDNYNFMSNTEPHAQVSIPTNDELISVSRDIPYHYGSGAGASSLPYRERVRYYNNDKDDSGYEEITYPGHRTFRRSYDADGNLLNEGFYTRVRKHDNGGSVSTPIKVHHAWSRTPRFLSFMAAYMDGKSKDLPKREGTTVNRSFARIKYPNGTIVDRIHREDGNGNTYRIITPKRDTTYEYNGELFFPGSEMYDRYEKAWKQYGVYHDGGKINKFYTEILK